MLVEGLKSKGISDTRVLNAFAKVPRTVFVPEDYRDEAEGDYPLPIGFGQTISQPYVVAFMTEAILKAVPKTEKLPRVLEIGTGSGYQAAILAHVADQVFTVELIPELLEKARQNVDQLGLKNISFKSGDGRMGWEEKGPFDGILVTAAAEKIPEKLLEQLKPEGRMIVPVGLQGGTQQLVLIWKEPDGLIRTSPLLPVRFVPLMGKK
jgi:protein-L-isoaspartate(D-aspartate) O-methyltransferase